MFTKGPPVAREDLRAVIGEALWNAMDEGARDSANQGHGSVTITGIDRKAGVITWSEPPRATRLRNPSRRDVAEDAIEGRDMTLPPSALKGWPNRHERRKAAKVNLARKDRVAR